MVKNEIYASKTTDTFAVLAFKSFGALVIKSNNQAKINIGINAVITGNNGLL